jgi:flagellar M-ring protein FliF
MGMTLSMEEKVQTAAEAVIHAPAADETVTGRIVHVEDFDPLFAMSEEDCVEGFIKREMQRAGITEEQNLIPEDMLRRKNILNAVLAVLLFVYISLFFFHFPMKTYVIGLIILVVYAFLTSRYQLIKYLKKEIRSRSQEKISNIVMNVKASKILFSGADQDDDATVVSDSLDIKDRIKNSVVNGIKDVMVKSGMYSDVQVAPNLDIDMSKVEKAVHNYSHNDGQDQGELTESSEYNSEAKGGQAATPGTDSNDDTPTYVTQDGEITESSVSDVDKKYSPNEEIIKTISNGGAINYDNSSIAVTATRWVVYDEDELKDSGQLKGTTFEKFKSAHSDPVQVDATQDEIDLIAKATGIQSSAIKLVCYERPQFVESQKKGFGLTDILQILLAVLIFALLGYVVFRSTRKQKVEEPEPELSVDALLAATSDNDDENLEDIGYSEKSETRKLIEKFVDENPDAAALLLRNWLNDDWE